MKVSRVMLNRSNIALITKVFKLDNTYYGFLITGLVILCSVYEVYFLSLVGSVVDGDDYCLPLTTICFSRSDMISSLVIAFALRSLLTLYSNFKLYSYSIGYIGHLSAALGKNITRIPAKDYAVHDSTHTIYTEVNQVVNNVVHPLLLIMRDVVFVAAIIIYLIYQFELMAAIFFFYVILGSAVIVMVLIPVLQAMGKQRQALDQQRLRRTNDLTQLRHEFFLTVKDNNLVNKQFEHANEHFSKVVAKYMFLRASNRTFFEVVLFFSMIGTAMSISMDGAAEFYTVLAVAALRILPAVTNIIGFANGFSFHIPALQQVGQLLDAVKPDHEKSNNGDNTRPRHEVKSFEVAFSRHDEEKTVTHSFVPGVLNIIAGKSGVGKSTLIKSLTGESELFRVSSYINGVGVSDQEVQSLIAYCPQDIHVVDAGLMDNALLLTEPLDYQVHAAENQMRGLGFGDSLIKRDNVKASTISGGQKRKLAFLRCILLNRSILICDEPTSELDDESAASITNILKELSKDHLVIVTSHDDRLIGAAGSILQL